MDSFEMQREHLQSQLFVQKANNKRLKDVEEMYNRARGELATKNQRITELESQLNVDANFNNKILIQKCCQLESHIERLNKVIIEMKANEASKGDKDKTAGGELEEYKRKYSQMLESMRSLQNQSSEHKFPPLEELMNQLEQNPSKLRLMENIISGLRT